MSLKALQALLNLFKKRSAQEDLRIEASLFLIFDSGRPKSYFHILEVRIINTGGLPVSIKSIVCSSRDSSLFGGVEKVFITDDLTAFCPQLEKKGQVYHENLEVETPDASQFESSKPALYVTTGTGKVFQAAIDPGSIKAIKAYEAGKGE